METVVDGWHFLKEDRLLRYGDGRKVVVGETLKYTGKLPVKLCFEGLHACRHITSALPLAPGTILCRVEVGGVDMVEYKIRNDYHIDKFVDKFVGTSRKVLWMLDASNIMHEFACRCAEKAAEAHPEIDISQLVIKRAWLEGLLDIDDVYNALDLTKKFLTKFWNKYGSSSVYFAHAAVMGALLADPRLSAISAFDEMITSSSYLTKSSVEPPYPWSVLREEMEAVLVSMVEEEAKRLGFL